jgi:hypothetical protein
MSQPSESPSVVPSVRSIEHPPQSADPPTAVIVVNVFTSLAAAALVMAFFMPWIALVIGWRGVDVMRTETYSFVVILPLLSIVLLVLSLLDRSVAWLRRLTGLVPFLILAYGLYHFGMDLFRGLMLGAWLSLIAGAVLLLLPNPIRPKPKADDV